VLTIIETIADQSTPDKGKSEYHGKKIWRDSTKKIYSEIRFPSDLSINEPFLSSLSRHFDPIVIAFLRLACRSLPKLPGNTA